MRRALGFLVLGVGVFASPVFARSGFYVGGQLGLTSLASSYRKGVRPPSAQKKRGTGLKGIPDSGAFLNIFSKRLGEFRRETLDASREMAFVPLQRGRDPHGANVTLWSGEGCGFGVAPECFEAEGESCSGLTLQNAGGVVQDFLNKAVNIFNGKFEDLGFKKLAPYAPGEVLVDRTDGGGRAHVLCVRSRPIMHSAFPSLRMDVIAPLGSNVGGEASDPAEEKKVEAYRLRFKDADFIGVSQLQDACYNMIFGDVAGQWNRALLKEFLSSPDSAYALASYEALNDSHKVLNEAEIKNTSHHLSLAVVVGWDRLCRRAERALLGCYFGVEAFARLDCGQVTLAGPSLPHITQSKLNLKTRQSFGCSVLPGLSLPKGCVVHAVLTGRLTRHHFEIVRGAETSEGAALGAFLRNVEEEPTVNEAWSNSVTKWKPGFEGGLGVRTPVGRNLTLGLRWTHSIENKIEFKTPAYASKAYSDLERFGATHTIKLSDQRVALELLYRF